MVSWVDWSGDQTWFSRAAAGVGARGREPAELGEEGEGGQPRKSSSGGRSQSSEGLVVKHKKQGNENSM